MSISRRRLLQGITYLSSYAGIGRLNLIPLPGTSGPMALLQAAEGPEFLNPDIIRYDAQCFTIHGRDTFLYSACCHYTRTPKELWRDRLTRLKQAGFNTIETYVFWNYHEPVEGQVDMSLLEEFIHLVHKMDLWLITRVGPYACAEWDAGGFPHWIIEKQFPLRSDHPESVRTSKNWFSHVLPVVRRNMITSGGPVILVQIENEYDYWKLPAGNKLKYMTVLAETAWKAGINVPLITNWCKQARDNSDPVMAKIMDTCDFYPRWNIVPEVVPQLDKLRQQEPTSPVSIAELQGGWFSEFGGKLSVDQVGVTGLQFNALTKTVIENATTFLSVYMGHGGTNFDWAAHGLTTTYDYAAPVREPGGLWDKYYAARRIGAFLDKFGPLVARAKNIRGAIISDNHDVSTSMRADGESGVLFVRNNADSPQKFSLTLRAPGSSNESTQIPRHGKLAISRRGMKLLPVNLKLSTDTIHYCTAEVLTYGDLSGRSYLTVYDAPGSLVEIVIQATHASRVDGEVLYQHFDAGRQRAVLGFRMESAQKHLLINGSLQIIALPPELADRTWTAQFPTRDAGATVESPVITDCALMRGYNHDASGTTLQFEYTPGEHHLSILEHSPASSCSVDGETVHIQRDQRSGIASIAIQTPALSFTPVAITEGDYWVESFDLSHGSWLTTRPKPLEALGQIPYSYVKYRAQFEWHGEHSLYLDTFTEDAKQVFLNGTRVLALSRPVRSLSCPLASHARMGSNLLEISYESFGSPNFGPTIQNLKGVSGIHIGDERTKTAVAELHVQMTSAAMIGREVNPEYSTFPWRHAKIGAVPHGADLVSAYTWFRSTFFIQTDPRWFCPLKLHFAADCDALIYVNGKFVGFYRTIGPQSEFYLPEPYLQADGDQENILTVRLAYTESPASLKQLVIEPYTEFASRKTTVKFLW